MQQLLLGVLVAILYLATGVLSGAVARATTQTTPVWLAAGVLFSALLICARWSWPAILIGGGIAATIWIAIAHGLGWGGALAGGAIESISMAIGAWIATLGRHDPRRPAGTALLIAGALIGSALGGVLGAQLWEWHGRGIDFWSEWLTWTASTGLGVLLVVPVVIAFRGFHIMRSGGMPMPQFLGGALAFLAFTVTVVVVFGDNAGQQFGGLASTLAYLPMPFLLLTGLLWGPGGGSLATLVGSLYMVWRTASGGGPFAIAEDFPGQAVVAVQVFVIVWVLAIRLGRALTEDRRLALEQARAWRLRYERTMLGVGVASVEYDAVTGRATWGDGAALVLGPAVSTVSTVSEWLDRIEAAERGLVQANWSAVLRGDVPSSDQDYAVHLGGGQYSRVNEQLAGVRGPDGKVEQVVGLLRLVTPEGGGMTEPGVFLIHGLGGTQYDLGSMHKRLKNAGFVTHSLTLPGHGTKPEDLSDVHAEDWIEAVRTKYLEVLEQHEVLHVMGMCMGALLAVETAKRERHAKGRLVALAPPIYIDGWATPWYRGFRPLLYRVPGMPRRMKVAEEDPYGIKNEQLREIVKAKFERGENFHYGWVPLACIREVDRLRGMVMKALDRIACPTLIVHARLDELTSLHSANFLVEHIGAGTRAGQARMVVLEDSYHMVCIDNDREVVAKNVLEFFGASVAGSLGMSSDDPRMTPAQTSELLAAALADLERGDFVALFERGIPDFAWFQPGSNRASGIFRGRKGLPRLQAWASPASVYTAFGAPVVNAGMAVVPATLRTGSLTSQGVLAMTMRHGRLLESRWFPDDVRLEDAHFGGEPIPDGPSEAERAFEAAAAQSKTLRRAPDNDTLLALYALYKQGSLGDVTGGRPGLMDVVGRSKYDAWSSKRGMARELAMSEYVALLNRLKAAEAQAPAGG